MTEKNKYRYLCHHNHSPTAWNMRKKIVISTLDQIFTTLALLRSPLGAINVGTYGNKFNSDLNTNAQHSGWKGSRLPPHYLKHMESQSCHLWHCKMGRDHGSWLSMTLVFSPQGNWHLATYSRSFCGELRININSSLSVNFED